MNTSAASCWVTDLISWPSWAREVKWSQILCSALCLPNYEGPPSKSSDNLDGLANPQEKNIYFPSSQKHHLCDILPTHLWPSIQQNPTLNPLFLLPLFFKTRLPAMANHPALAAFSAFIFSARRRIERWSWRLLLFTKFLVSLLKNDLQMEGVMGEKNIFGKDFCWNSQKLVQVEAIWIIVDNPISSCHKRFISLGMGHVPFESVFLCPNRMKVFFWLVVEPTPLENYARQNGFISSPNFRGENKKYVSCHHLALWNNPHITV